MVYSEVCCGHMVYSGVRSRHTCHTQEYADAVYTWHTQEYAVDICYTQEYAVDTWHTQEYAVDTWHTQE